MVRNSYEPGGDLVLAPGPGFRSGFIVPAAELVERFSRSSGPGGQGVNTTDSRVELRWRVFDSQALARLSQAQRLRVESALQDCLVSGWFVVVASEPGPLAEALSGLPVTFDTPAGTEPGAISPGAGSEGVPYGATGAARRFE